MRRLRSRPAEAWLLMLAATCSTPATPLAGQDHAGERGEHGGHEEVEALEPGRIEVRHEADEHRILARLGPFSLPGAGNTMRVTPAEVIVVPADGWLIAFEARILDPRGQPLPMEILHHINVVRPDRRELFLPIMQRVAAAGHETGRIATPFPFGIAAAAGDTLLVSAMLHNPTGEPREVVVEAWIRYDTPAWLDRVAVHPFHMDIQPPPQSASFDLPPGRSEFAWSGRPAVDVEVLLLGGHMHALGRELRLEELQPDGSSKVLWRTSPEFRDDGLVAEIPRKTFLVPFGLGLSSDRDYRLVAIYHNPTGALIPDGGMAEIGGVALPRGAWPAADRQDPWFHSDYVKFTRHNPALRTEATSSPEGDPPGGHEPQGPDGDGGGHDAHGHPPGGTGH